MSLVINPVTPKATKVKNLGWLLRNWREVRSFTLQPFDSDYVSDGFLVASMNDGRVYLSRFASFEIARRWLHRPVFRGLPLNDCGNETIC